LLEEITEDPYNPWLLYRYAWVCNRMEKPADALEPALAAWRIEPDNQWYLAEYVRALKNLEMYDGLIGCGDYIRGGGVCRYYLAVAERELSICPSPSVEYLITVSTCDDDSAAADACVWLAILLGNEAEADSIITLVETAAALAPDVVFYRCILAEKLAENGETERSREQLHFVRLEGSMGYSYWQACASLAEAEEDADRRIWALRRARNSRICPETSRNLGWTLYFSGRDALREGKMLLSRERLWEAVSLGDSSEIFVQKADSLLELIYEFENSISDSY
jgi:tetratricopeptide (TPR) repeat protein